MIPVCQLSETPRDPILSVAAETRAVLFADLVGCTAAYERMGNHAAKDAVDRRLQALKRAVHQHHGLVIKSLGDAILACFNHADHAAAAALKMQADVVNDMAAGTGIFNLRIGFHLGDVLFDATDIFGDAVNVAARITDAARAGQILTSGETVARLGGLHLGRARAFDHVRLKGKTDPVHLYEVVWEQEEEVTRMANGPGLRPEGMTLPDHHHLNLVLGDRHLRFAPARLPVSLGRDGACDLPVDHPLASRRHAQCEYLRGKFVFSDHSTNGSFVTGEDGREVFLRRESMPLVGRGVISLGCPLREQSGPVLRFQVE